MESFASDGVESAGISVFLSYARKDEEALGFIEPFKNLLSYFISAKAGRDLSTFVDVESIQWGDLWWDEIKKSVLSATVFIPILSANYLKSDNCRKEFTIFNSTASNMGVSELVLPVLLYRAPVIFKPDSNDEIVQTVMERQFEVIEEASMTSHGSPEWKATMSTLADRFIAAYERAEGKLAAVTTQEAKELEASGSAGEEELPGIADLLPVLEEQIEELTSAAQELEPAITSIEKATVTSEPPQGATVTPKALQLWAFRAANAFKDPAIKIENSGTRLFNSVQRLDQTIAEVKRISEDVEEFQEPYQKMIQAFGDLGETRDSLSGLLQSLKIAESLSGAVRRSLKPMRTGLTLVQDSLLIMDSWRSELLPRVDKK